MVIFNQWGINLILALQRVPGWTGVMKFYSLFGTEEFFLVAMPVIYWCVDASVGLRLAVALVALQQPQQLAESCLSSPAALLGRSAGFGLER